jgi:hypothetical protein
MTKASHTNISRIKAAISYTGTFQRLIHNRPKYFRLIESSNISIA